MKELHNRLNRIYLHSGLPQFLFHCIFCVPLPCLLRIILTSGLVVETWKWQATVLKKNTIINFKLKTTQAGMIVCYHYTTPTSIKRWEVGLEPTTQRSLCQCHHHSCNHLSWLSRHKPRDIHFNLVWQVKTNNWIKHNLITRIHSIPVCTRRNNNVIITSKRRWIVP